LRAARPTDCAPPKIVCVGLNDADHARESGQTLPWEPSILLKAPDTLAGPNDDVLIPRRSTKTDDEVELGVMIGRVVRYLADPSSPTSTSPAAGCPTTSPSVRASLSAAASGQGQVLRNRQPLGPWLVTPEEVGDPRRLQRTTRVDGELRQDGCTRTRRSASMTWSGT